MLAKRLVGYRKRIMPTYKVIRRFFDDRFPSEVIETDLTLKQAQKHCQDKQTSSRTCSHPEAVELTERCGEWFDSFEEE